MVVHSADRKIIWFARSHLLWLPACCLTCGSLKGRES